MAPGRMRVELVRIRREIRRAADGHREAKAILDQASRDHQRVMRELATVKNKNLRQELLELAAKVQEEGRLTRQASRS
ncbi:MAG: hypothetical protein ACRDLB_05195 [Actinomycetota bacterium]